MAEAMRDFETLRQPEASPSAEAAARHRLASILQEAAERRDKLALHLAMADEFIHVLDQRLSSPHRDKIPGRINH
jgi:hypothetical protein